MTYSLPSGSVKESTGEKPAVGPHADCLPGSSSAWLSPHIVPRHRMPTSQRPGAEAPEELLAEEIEFARERAPERRDESHAPCPRTNVTAAAARPSRRRAPPEEAARARRTAPRAASRKTAAAAQPRHPDAWSAASSPPSPSPPTARGARPSDAVTLQQVAADDAQSLVVASDSPALRAQPRAATRPRPRKRSTKKKAEEAAAAARRSRARAH